MLSHITLKEEVLNLTRVTHSHFQLKGGDVSLSFFKSFTEMPVMVGPIPKTQQFQIHQDIEMLLKSKRIINEACRLTAVTSMNVNTLVGVWRGESSRLEDVYFYVKAVVAGNGYTLDIFRARAVN